MNASERQELKETGRLILFDIDDLSLGSIVGDLMNLGIDPFKVSIGLTYEGDFELVVKKDKVKPVWRSSKDDSIL